MGATNPSGLRMSNAPVATQNASVRTADTPPGTIQHDKTETSAQQQMAKTV